MYQAIPTRRSPNYFNRLSGLGAGDPVTEGIQLASAGVNTWLNQINLAHNADTATTQIVNGLAPKLQALKDAYMAGPGTCQDQAAAEAAYMTAVNWLMSAHGCGNGAYGSAGNRCISDRFGGGGPTDPNAKWPWAAYYYLPIANDPRAAQCAAQLASDNPEAAQQAAMQNILNTATGSTVQTSAGLYDTTGAGSTATTNTTTGTGITSTTVAGIPLMYVLIGGALLLVVAMK